MAARAPFSLLAALFLVRFADEWFTFFPFGALEPIRADLGLSYTQVGVALAALSAAGLVGNGISVAADYVDRRVLASLGALVYGLAMLAFGLGHSFGMLVVAAAVWGLASDAFISGTEVTLVQLYPDDLAPVLGRVNAYGAIGDLLGPLTLAGAVGIGLGWRSVFVLGGGLMLLYAVALAVQKFPKSGATAPPSEAVAGIVAVARDRGILVLAVVDALYGLLDEPFQGFSIAYFERVRGLDPVVATAIIAAWVIASIVGFWIVPVFSSRFPAQPLLLGFAGFIAVAVVTLVFAPLVPVQALGAVGFGFGGAVFYSVLQANLLGAQPERAGTVRAVVSTIGLVGDGFPALVGLVVDAHGLTAGLAVYAVVPLIMLVLLIPGQTTTARRWGVE